MATVTPNFGWDIPQSTDLVKDGATAIAALGNDIDTSMVDLKGGTTGQVLSKASNTDMDFTWVAQDDSDAIQNSIVDAKGDIITATAADTPARLAVGSNGFTLVADSSASTGLAYAGTTNGNPVLNSAYQIWQRGTSIAVGASSKTYTADRWWGARGSSVAGETISRQATGDTTNLPFIQYAARVQRDSGNTSTQFLSINQDFESVNSIPYAGRAITFSFYARKGANFSGASDVMSFSFITGTGTDQSISTGFTGQVTAISGNATLTTTWQRFTYTGNIGSTATQIALQIYYTPVGTAGANDYFEITGVQIDLGSTALPFRTNGNTIQEELAACQRYYSTSLPLGTTTHSLSTCQLGVATDSAYVTGMRFPVAMRTTPTVTVFSRNNTSGKMSASSNGADTAATNATNIGNNQIWAWASSGLTTGAGYEFSFTASAEL